MALLRGLVGKLITGQILLFITVAGVLGAAIGALVERGVDRGNRGLLSSRAAENVEQEGKNDYASSYT